MLRASMQNLNGIWIRNPSGALLASCCRVVAELWAAVLETPAKPRGATGQKGLPPRTAGISIKKPARMVLDSHFARNHAPGRGALQAVEQIGRGAFRLLHLAKRAGRSRATVTLRDPRTLWSYRALKMSGSARCLDPNGSALGRHLSLAILLCPWPGHPASASKASLLGMSPYKVRVIRTAI